MPHCDSRASDGAAGWKPNVAGAHRLFLALAACSAARIDSSGRIELLELVHKGAVIAHHLAQLGLPSRSL